MIEWDSAWDTGIDIVDSEHKTLVELLRRIQNEDPKYLRASLLSLSSEVTNHATMHFMHEERLSAVLLSPEQSQAHSNDHRRWKQLLLRENAALQLKLASPLSEKELQDIAQEYVAAIFDFFATHWENHDCKICPSKDCM